MRWQPVESLVYISHPNLIFHTALPPCILLLTPPKVVLSTRCQLGRVADPQAPITRTIIPGGYELDRVKDRKENITWTCYIHGETLRCMRKPEK